MANIDPALMQVLRNLERKGLIASTQDLTARCGGPSPRKAGTSDPTKYRSTTSG